MEKIKLVITGIAIFALSFGIMAQGPPEPPQDHSSTADEDPGNRAPLDGGLFILLGLGAAYSGKKVYSLKKKK